MYESENRPVYEKITGRKMHEKSQKKENPQR